MSIYNYPEPRCPSYQQPASVEDCLPQARILARKEHGRIAMGPVRKGDKLLIVSLDDQDKYVREAITQALKEEGAQQVDFLYEHQLSGGEPRLFDVAQGWKEADTIENAPWDMSGSLFYTDLSGNLYKFLQEHPEYTGVFYGLGGRQNLRYQLREYRDKFRGCWLFNNWEEFLSRTWVFPDELEVEIERRIIAAMGKAAAVRITDPEGTHLEFPLSADEAGRWEANAWDPGHLLMDPFQATTEECARRPVAPEVAPVFLDINGVLAGTANHMGYTPRIQLYFARGRLVKVEGGGQYGDIIRELMDKYRDVHWPGYPDKGFFWYCDSALCTVVKAFRRTSDMFQSYWRLPNITERNRAGIFHMGFGSRRHGKDYLKYAGEHHLPMGHIHVHLYFATFEIKLRGTDYWYKIIDKGRPTAMDDPEVRALAVQYGNPEELLSFDWVPPLPGINCEGDYRRDYAPDPVAYLKRRLKEGQPV